MPDNWTFGKKVAAGFVVTVALALVIGCVAVYALRSVAESKDRVINSDTTKLIAAEQITAATERKSSQARGFLLTRDPSALDEMQKARREFGTLVQRLRASTASADSSRLLDGIERAESAHQAALDVVIALRQGDTSIDSVARAFESQVVPKRDALTAAVAAYVEHEQDVLGRAVRSSTQTAESAINLVIGIALGIVLLAALIAVALTRTLGRQIGSAVGHVQSSSAELQSAASQQATGARQQATAMNEITTTINELLASSRQIAESAQRVAEIAEQTAGASRAGQATLERSQDSIGGIRRQMDLVVSHMLDLGKKSQQVGAVLEIVSELAEQTNILAINATIEAAGAGDAGKRFAVVADEIRKLADRVGGSTKEIRTLIEDVRGAVNATVMSTESGSKAVDAGSRQFSDVAAALKQIATLVSTTTEAAREIELSTKQQATAVEQVNVAVSNVAQATKETEASSGQTLQTAAQLADLSRELLRLVRQEAA